MITRPPCSAGWSEATSSQRTRREPWVGGEAGAGGDAARQVGRERLFARGGIGGVVGQVGAGEAQGEVLARGVGGGDRRGRGRAPRQARGGGCAGRGRRGSRARRSRGVGALGRGDASDGSRGGISSTRGVGLGCGLVRSSLEAEGLDAFAAAAAGGRRIADPARPAAGGGRRRVGGSGGAVGAGWGSGVARRRVTAGRADWRHLGGGFALGLGLGDLRTGRRRGLRRRGRPVVVDDARGEHLGGARGRGMARAVGLAGAPAADREISGERGETVCAGRSGPPPSHGRSAARTDAPTARPRSASPRAP